MATHPFTTLSAIIAPEFTINGTFPFTGDALSLAELWIEQAHSILALVPFATGGADAPNDTIVNSAIGAAEMLNSLALSALLTARQGAR